MDGGDSREIVLSRHTCIRYTFLHFMALSLCLNRETIQNQNICTLGWPQVYQQWTAAFPQIMTAWVGSSTQQQLACKKTKRFYSCYNWFCVYVPYSQQCCYLGAASILCNHFLGCFAPLGG